MDSITGTFDYGRPVAAYGRKSWAKSTNVASTRHRWPIVRRLASTKLFEHHRSSWDAAMRLGSLYSTHGPLKTSLLSSVDDALATASDRQAIGATILS